MYVTIRLFARLREITGGSELTLELPERATALDAWKELTRRYPELEPYTLAVACAVNEDYAGMTVPLRHGDEVAFLPPVSGG